MFWSTIAKYVANQHVFYSLGTATIGLSWVMTFLVGIHICLGAEKAHEMLVASRHTSL